MLLNIRERDSKIFKEYEIIFEEFARNAYLTMDEIDEMANSNKKELI